MLRADAFYGQNNKIRETLNSLILNSPQEWQTSVALPFVRIEGTVSSAFSCRAHHGKQLTNTIVRADRGVG